jgi:hypothetical protein
MAYTGDCTFFVDTDEAPRVSLMEQARLHARALQDQIGNEMSRLVHEQYLEDIMEHLKIMEVCFFSLSLCLLPGYIGD